MKKLTILLIATLLLVGCGKDKVVQPNELLHHYFILVKANGQPIDMENVTHQPYLEFGQDFRINGRMCNTFFGQAQYQDGKLSSEGLASTKMLCASDQLNQLDNEIATLLQEGAGVSLKEKTLILSSGKNKLEYELKDTMN